MIIFIEHRSHHHKTVGLPNEVCPLCQDSGKLKLHIMQKYQHFIGPLTPLPKYGVLECDACDKTIPNKGWNAKLDAIYKKERASVKTPSRMWRGMWVLPLMFLLFIGALKIAFPSEGMTMEEYDKNVAASRELIRAAKVGDILYISHSGVQSQEDLKTNNAVVQIAKIVGDTAFMKTYPERWSIGYDHNKIKKTDLDLARFSNELIPMSYSTITQNLLLTTLKGKENEGSSLYATVKGIIQ